jgi:hypothetical protein
MIKMGAEVDKTSVLSELNSYLSSR